MGLLKRGAIRRRVISGLHGLEGLITKMLKPANHYLDLKEY
jgi:hypothetical protein